MTPRPLLGPYAARLRRRVSVGPLPLHLGIITDGNRRWARRSRLASVSEGHEHGARKVREVLGWCAAVGIPNVTVYVCSADNLARRDAAEVDFLMRLIERVVSRELSGPAAGWQVHLSGTVDLLPGSTARALKDAVESTRDSGTGRHLTLAVGYSGRQEIVEAVRAVLLDGRDRTPAELADTLTQADIDGRLETAGRPDPELIIRTSGEQRLSDFLLWQGIRSELWFCDAYWPAFREVDFLRALRDYARRSRPH